VTPAAHRNAETNAPGRQKKHGAAPSAPAEPTPAAAANQAANGKGKGLSK
jgi:hypothetical protein